MDKSAYDEAMAMQLHTELCGLPFERLDDTSWFLCTNETERHTYWRGPQGEFWCREAMAGPPGFWICRGRTPAGACRPGSSELW